MTDRNKSTLYSYPMRGFGIITIFLVLGPAVQTIVGTYLLHPWVGGSNLLVEIFDVFSDDACPKLLAGYSYYMPSVFLSGVFCSLPPSRGLGLSLSSAIWRTILVSLCVEIFYIIMSRPYMQHMTSENILRNLSYGFIQWIFVGWVCWILATGFRLDKPVVD
ncbi:MULTISPECIES: hypothetical protein [Bartonella]|uniref:Transmembrane protein n=1 Tax=Bartonella choladocola TaxID=2750995 RepID=A0A1U9MF04_9HYPH|nr:MULTISPECIES: hypothetical protein [Bartonella]AQT46318.1 hypothetical protein BBC0122_001780 [Bartonella choladocola]MBH9974677.1 hypothetical protein [Bartonella choladocola]MBI0014284.1 hypothetical protein [Bartonella sp. B10834G3]MBI0139685.1 hypothetical protein [Bartonella choladocola]